MPRWRKALFIKLMRGDASDSVFSAFPGVRYEGKKISICAAWEDRIEQGYDPASRSIGTRICKALISLAPTSYFPILSSL